jgi:hypothetical protein
MLSCDNSPELHHWHGLRVNDGTKSIQCIIQWDICELFSNYCKYPLHPACCAKLACTGQLLHSCHKYLIMQRSTPDGSSNLHMTQLRLQILSTQVIFRDAFLTPLGLSGHMSRHSTKCYENIGSAYHYY